MDQTTHRRAVRLFALVLACAALANGLGSNIFSNYFCYFKFYCTIIY